MRRFLARVLRIPDARREEHLLETAMRTTPRPVPPAGLRDRLVADALAAADQLSPQRHMSHAWMAALAAPAAVLVIALAWLAFGGHGEKHAAPSRTSTQQAASAPTTTTGPQRSPDTPLPERKAAPSTRPVIRPPVHVGKQAPTHRQEPNVVPDRPQVPEQPMLVEDVATPDEPAEIHVTVSRMRDGETGYARAASYDENGVRTEWTIVDGGEGGESRSGICMTDDTGPRLCLTVSSLQNSRSRLEDRL